MIVTKGATDIDVTGGEQTTSTVKITSSQSKIISSTTKTKVPTTNMKLRTTIKVTPTSELSNLE